jgi:chitodextrinase
MGGFTTLAGTTNLCNFNGISGQCGNGSWIENDPTGRSSKAYKIQYQRTDTVSSADRNRGLNLRNFPETAVFGQRLYVEGDWFLVPYGPTIAEQRKLIYINAGRNPHAVLKLHGSTGKLVQFMTSVRDNTDPNTGQKYCGPNQFGSGSSMVPRNVYTFADSEFNRWIRIGLDVTASSGINVPDGKADLYIDGVLVKTVTGLCTHDVASGWRHVQIGQQANADKLYDEFRYLDNVLVANYKPGTTYTPPPPPPPATSPVPVITLTASPTSITSGQSSTLTWSATNASSCSGAFMSGSGTSGTAVVSPTQTTSYSITCTGLGGSATKSVSVSVGSVAPPPSGDTTPPSIPQNLLGTPISTTEIRLTWSASTDNVGVTGYKLYRNGILIATPGPSALNYSNTGLTPNTTYTYTIAARDLVGNTSALSAPVNATTLSGATTPPPDTTSPSIPQNLIATAVSTSQINLSWSPSTDNVGVTGYKIYRNGSLIFTSTGTSFSNTSGLSPATTYSYAVAAVDAAGNSSNQSLSVSATTQGSSFPTPTVSITASPASITAGQSSTLTWSSTNATGCTASGDWSGTRNTSGTQSVTPAANSTYSLSCSGSGGSASDSATVSVTPVAVPPTQGQAPVISNVAISQLNSSSATITWNTDNLADSQVKYGTDTSFTQASTINVTPTTAHSVKISKLRAGTTYYYKVVSKNSLGLSAESSSQTFTTASKPSMPLNLKALAAMVWEGIRSILGLVF